MVGKYRRRQHARFYSVAREYAQSHGQRALLAEKLTELTSATIIVTGVEKNGKIGELILNGGKYELVLLEKLPAKRHGTGDIFASVFTAKYLGGESLAASCAAASTFVIDCLKQTDPDHFYGVNFEKVLNK
ncbi:MAG: bifunctional hydroxymethylpyrimidine kinase/phosphomethylpyrimidine kinase [Clostridia bacterium]|nr:bifunctional hydroxymethylpyrimidine kinase/phosphomethylpyrimidine kinase [Clostridia bacterium]